VEESTGFLDKIVAFFSKLTNLFGQFLMSGAAPIVFGIIAVVILFFVLRAIYRKLRDKHLPNLTFERQFSEPGVWAGDSVDLIETISNHGFFPMLRVQVEAFIYNELRLVNFEPPKKDGMQFFGERFNIWSFMRIRRRHKIECLRRGYFIIESVSVPMKDEDYFYSSPAEIYIYPKPLPIQAVAEAAGRMQGDDRAVRQLFQDPFTLSGVRDYRFGDSVSSINFKASSKTWMASSASSSPLKVNARDFCANRKLAVYMDFHLERGCGIDGDHFHKRVEVGLSYCAAIIREAIYGGFQVAFYCNCKQKDGEMALRFPMASGEDHMVSIFKAMAQLLPADGASFAMLLDEAIEESVSDTEIYVISLCPEEKKDERINTLRQMGNTVREILLSPIDEELYDS